MKGLLKKQKKADRYRRIRLIIVDQARKLCKKKWLLH